MKTAAAASLLFASCLGAHDLVTTKITWSAEIARIVNAKCIRCHAGSISFASYKDARPWAKAIKEEVLERRMPPWGAVKGFGEFQNDTSLSQEELMLIAEWVEGGAPEGDPNLLPRPIAPQPIAPQEISKTSTHGVAVRGPIVLKNPILLGAIRPMTAAENMQIIARLPDGSVVPLLWLYQYRSEWKRTFTYREPVLLPKGTIIEMTTPARIELISAGPRPGR